jgi:streptogrisin C
MRIKTALTASILLLAVGAAPALAQEQRLDGSAEVMESISRDTGLSDEQLKTLLPAQDRAIAIDAKLKRSIGEQYGLSYFDSKSEKLIVNVTDDELAKQVEAVGAAPNFVKHSLRELTGILIGLGGSDTASGKREIVKSESPFAALSLDPISNTVAISATKEQSEAAREAAAKYGEDVVSVNILDEAPKATAFMDGGDGINGNSCSAGFNLRNPSTGARYLLTAGHCVNAGNTLRGQGNVAFGTVLESWFPSYDDSITRYNNNGMWTQGPWVDTNPSNGGIVTTTGSTDAPVGTIVCKSGITTKFTCGYIRGKNETVHYDSGETVFGLTRHSACVEPGDSGGANVSLIGGRYRAEGVTSGASLINNQCRSKFFFGIFENVSWYFPIADSLAYYGPKYGVTTW